ncbi:MAG: hypothetical protein IJV15_09195 [Lachnospiraceae bacterium]|nr:hypothetical protein [Lachnospiraceae bacterium]
MMKENTENGMLEDIEISLEEFDEVDEYHNFSDKYKNKKKEALKMYRKKHLATKRHTGVKVAAAIAAFAIATPLAVNAATNGDLFNRLWGNAGKEDVESYTYEWDEDWGDETKHFEVEMPAIDYEDTDPEKAEKLVGDNILEMNDEYDLDGTKMTILSTVSDGNCMVVEYTLEREGGVKIYNLDHAEHSNETKGNFPEIDQNVNFDFGKVYIDLEKSTEEKMYCYSYAILASEYQENETPTIYVQILPCTIEEYAKTNDPEEFDKILDQIVEVEIPLNTKEQIDMKEYVNADGGVVEVSPISMSIDESVGLGLPSYDPYYIYYVNIKYKDGTEYLVSESNCDSKEFDISHSCDVEHANYQYVCGFDNEFKIAFNRLCDVDNIESITVNETTYTLR